MDSKVVHHNQPILMEVIVYPQTQNEKIIVIAGIIGGATNVLFSLVGSGQGTISAKITYSWPKIAFNIDELFEKAIKVEKLPDCHPSCQR